MRESSAMGPFFARIGGREWLPAGIEAILRRRNGLAWGENGETGEGMVIPVTFSGIEPLHNSRTFPEEVFGP
jgi:hypothetical protein